MSCGILSANLLSFVLSSCFCSTESIAPKLEEFNLDCALLILDFKISISFRAFCWIMFALVSASSASIASSKILFSCICFFKSSIDSLDENACDFAGDSSTLFFLCLE